jgi:amino acid permease
MFLPKLAFSLSLPQCSLGSFVFTFVSQHTVHLAYGSLKPELRTLKNWQTISTWSIMLATVVSLAMGLGVYMTYWQAAVSNIFQIYPASISIDLARLLLCVTMLLTFPLPFFTCREIIVQFFWAHTASLGAENYFDREASSAQSDDVPRSPSRDELEEHLLATPERLDRHAHACHPRRSDSISLTDLSTISIHAARIADAMLLPGSDRQLVFPAHVVLTAKLWFVVTAIAIVAPSLGDVLNLVGCASGSLIAFILPACISMKIRGYSHLAALLLLIGGPVGIVGTAFSLSQLLIDMAKAI